MVSLPCISSPEPKAGKCSCVGFHPQFQTYLYPSQTVFVGGYTRGVPEIRGKVM